MVRRMKLEIDGMSCQHCVHAVRSALEDLDGVEVRDVAIGTAELSVDSSKSDAAKIEAAVAEEGYQVREIS